MRNYKSLFLIDPEIVFLNHGSFGACPRPVFEAYQKWQGILEKQPVEFLGRRGAELLSHARQSLAEYLVTGRDEVVFFPNPAAADDFFFVREMKSLPPIMNTVHSTAPGASYAN